MTLKDLLGKNKFDAVFLANGANEPRKMGIPNENCYGSYDSRTYLSLNNAHRFFMKILNIFSKEHKLSDESPQFFNSRKEDEQINKMDVSSIHQNKLSSDIRNLLAGEVGGLRHSLADIAKDSIST